MLLMIITCPWCGTNYTKFRPNCQNCGGPISTPSNTTQDKSPSIDSAKLSFPDKAPREISSNYIWRLLFADAWAISALIFGLIGGIFAVAGAGLTIGIITAFVGLPFLGMGLLFLFSGAAVLVWRCQIAEKRVKVLKEGIAIEGEIIDIVENVNVRVNGRTPWKISYAFNLPEDTFEGIVTTLNPPGPQLASGNPIVILYLEDSPQFNSIYPHP
jgi:hypothetical protein